MDDTTILDHKKGLIQSSIQLPIQTTIQLPIQTTSTTPPPPTPLETQQTTTLNNIILTTLTQNSPNFTPSSFTNYTVTEFRNIAKKAPHLTNMLNSTNPTTLRERISNLLNHCNPSSSPSSLLRRVIKMAPKLLTFTTSGLNLKLQSVNSAIKSELYTPVASWENLPPFPSLTILHKSPQLYYLNPSTLTRKLLAYKLVVLFGCVPPSPRPISTVDMHVVNRVMRDCLETTPNFLMVGYGPISRVEWTRGEGRLRATGKTLDHGKGKLEVRRKRRFRSTYMKSNPNGSVGDMLDEELKNRSYIEDEEVSRAVKEWAVKRGGIEEGSIRMKVAVMGRGKFVERYGWKGEGKRGEILKEEVRVYHEKFYNGGE